MVTKAKIFLHYLESMSQLNSTIAVCYADTWMERISDTIQHQMSGDDIMIIRNVKTNFYKILTGYGFYICIIFTTILCFTANVYEDFETGNKYSAIMSIINFDKDFMLSNTNFCSFEIMRRGAGSWLSMFIPLVAAFSFVPLVCDEYEAKSVRFEVFRSSKLSFHLSKFITACLCGGIAVMLGFSLFTLTEYALFPNINEYSFDLKNNYEEMLQYQYIDITQGNDFIIIMRKFRDMFLYGAVNAAPVIMLTSIIRNKYIVLCIPKLQSQAAKSMENIDVNILNISSIFNPDALSYLSDYGKNRNLVLIYNGITIIIFAAIYLISCNRRFDIGE